MKNVISTKKENGITHKTIRAYKEKKVCLCCGSKRLRKIVDLGNQPLANSFHTKSQSLQTFPLQVNFCENCSHFQLSHIVNPDYLFKNYLYVSGTTKTLKDFFEQIATDIMWHYHIYQFEYGFLQPFSKKSEDEFPYDYVTDKVKEGREMSILDIACNDGSQLDAFKKLGLKTYGVDPAKNLVEISRKNHSVVCGYFDGNSLKGKTFDIITAQNVFAHVENPLKFLRNADRVLSKNGLLFIQVSQSNMFKNTEFDTVYHEHISYFTTQSMAQLVKRANMNLLSIEELDIHGGSKLFVIGKKNATELADAKSLVNTYEAIVEERKICPIYSHELEDYQKNVNKICDNTLAKLEKYKSEGYEIYCYGAAAKGMTFLNYLKPKGIKAVIDDNPLKVGLLTPGTNIEVKSIDEIKNSKAEKIVFLVLAWNFASEIKKRIAKVRDTKNDKFLYAFTKSKRN